MCIIQTYANQPNNRKTAVERQISCAINRTPTATAGTPQGILHFNKVKYRSCTVAQHHSCAASQHHTGTVLKRRNGTIIEKTFEKINCKNMLTNNIHSSTIKTVQR